jgi:hypothetical protein
MSVPARIAAAALAVGMSALIAAPAMAAQPDTTVADQDSNFGGGVNAANNWNFTAADVCIQELAVVPALSDWTGNHKNNCTNGNVLDHTGE